MFRIETLTINTENINDVPFGLEGMPMPVIIRSVIYECDDASDALEYWGEYCSGKQKYPDPFSTSDITQRFYRLYEVE